MMTLLAMTAKKLLTNIAVSLISEKFLEWALFNIAEKIVKSTETKHDDMWLAQIKESYETSKEK
ncbi:MAG: hypothetical protein ACRC6V_00420 [Bacteroidales bacterium]